MSDESATATLEPPAEASAEQAPEPINGHAAPSDIPAPLLAKWEEQEAALRKYEQSKGETAHLKKVWESKFEEFRNLMNEHNTPTPLFDAATGGPVDDWRIVPLTEALAGLPENILGRLKEMELETVGQFADWTNADGGKNKLIDIPGIGQAKAEKIENALADFWAKRMAEGKTINLGNGATLSGNVPAAISSAIAEANGAAHHAEDTESESEE